jgi:hypothetical protein
MFQRTAAAALMTAGALLVVGCGARELTEAGVQTTGAAPMAVSCEPNQRAIVRPAVVNGAAISQVECVSSGVVQTAAPVAYQPSAPTAVPVNYSSFAAPQAVPLEDARLARYPATVQAAPQRVVYQRVPERVIRKPKRSVAKSAIIIGSSAGAGAGVGALIGGKKGALIGAAVGGGGATLWDQVTRHKQ